MDETGYDARYVPLNEAFVGAGNHHLVGYRDLCRQDTEPPTPPRPLTCRPEPPAA